MAVNLGADCALGFTNETWENESSFFANRILSYYGGDSNNTIYASCVSAVNDTFNQYGKTGGVDSYKLVGNTSIKIAPASYGVY
jgi:hypothetical protein